MPVYDLYERGERVHDRNGQPMYEVRVYDGQLRKQVNRRAAGREQAEAIEADLLALVAIPLEHRRPTPAVVAAGQVQGRPVATTTTRITVRQWAVQYLELYAHRSEGTVRPPSSCKHDQRCLECYILPTLGPRTLSSVRLHELDDLVRCPTRKDGVTPLAGATKESVAGTLKRMFKMAHRRGIGPNTAADLSSSWGSASEARAAVVPSLSDVYRLAETMEAPLPHCSSRRRRRHPPPIVACLK